MKFAFHAERALPCIPTFPGLFCSVTSCLYKYQISHLEHPCNAQCRKACSVHAGIANS